MTKQFNWMASQVTRVFSCDHLDKVAKPELCFMSNCHKAARFKMGCNVDGVGAMTFLVCDSCAQELKDI